MTIKLFCGSLEREGGESDKEQFQFHNGEITKNKVIFLLFLSEIFEISFELERKTKTKKLDHLKMRRFQSCSMSIAVLGSGPMVYKNISNVFHLLIS